MGPVTRWLCLAALCLAACGRVAAAPSPEPAATSTSTTSIAPPSTSAPTTTTTTRSATPTSTIRSARPQTPPPTPTTAAAFRSSGRVANCGWAWDAVRVDDGSSNRVTVMLDSPGEPNASVTVGVKPGATLTNTPPLTQTTATDAFGQAAAEFALSDDKRDWTLTVSATFGSGAACTPQTFTVEY